MLYKVEAEKQVWNLSTYVVEANSKEEAKDLVYDGKGKLLKVEDEDVTDFQVLDINLIDNE